MWRVDCFVNTTQSARNQSALAILLPERLRAFCCSETAAAWRRSSAPAGAERLPLLPHQPNDERRCYRRRHALQELPDEQLPVVRALDRILRKRASA